MVDPGTQPTEPGALLFGALSGDDWAAATRRLRKISLAPDQTLYRHGDPSGSMYVVVSGQVDVRSGVAEGDGPPIASLGPGAILGELGMLSGASRTTTVVATSEVELWEIDGESLMAALDARERWAVGLLLASARGMARRLGKVDGQLAELMTEARSSDDDHHTAKVAELETVRRHLFAEWSF